MKLTITPSDNTVYKDGNPIGGLSLISVPKNVHALQWDGNSGWIEYVNESEFRKPPNEPITGLPVWAINALTEWDTANAALLAQPVVDGAQTL